MIPGDSDIERLKRRLERERRARREAEIIAERGMRELWMANSELRERVEARTAELERIIRSLGHRQRAHATLAALVADRLAESDAPPDMLLPAEVLRTLLNPRSPHVEQDRSNGHPLRFADELLERWQKVAARSGKLLSVEVRDTAAGDGIDWSIVQALADLLLTRSTDYGRPGALLLEVDTREGGLTLAVTDSGPQPNRVPTGVGPIDPLDWAGTGSGGSHLVAAALIARAAGGDVGVDVDGGATTVTVALPFTTSGDAVPT